jgi:SpoVK/Ycf46/Vps4 family AAA+-type ATPase
VIENFKQTLLSTNKHIYTKNIVMMINYDIQTETNKFINHINSINNSLIPCNLKSDGYNYYHSRDASYMMCSLVNLVNMGKIKLNNVLLILTHYINFEYKISKNYGIGNCNIFNENGTPLLNICNDINDYDVIAVKLLAFCQIYSLLCKNNYEYLVTHILFTHNTIIEYIKFLLNIYNIPCFDMWGEKFGVHYTNVKLYQMALQTCLNVIDNIYIDSIKTDIEDVIDKIDEILFKFNNKFHSRDTSYDIILPSLDIITVTRFSLDPSIFIPYLPIFGYTDQLIKDKKLVNTAMIILTNNRKNVFDKDMIKEPIPYVCRNNCIDSINNNNCVLSTIAVYNIIINMIDDKSDSCFNKWSTTDHNLLIKKTIKESYNLYEKLTDRMSNSINKTTNNICGFEYENMVRLTTSCYTYSILLKEEELINNNRLFRIFTKMDKIILNLKERANSNKLIKCKDDIVLDDNELCKCNNNLDTKIKVNTPTDISLQILVELAKKCYCYSCNKNKDVVLDDDLKKLEDESNVIKKIIKIHNPLQKLLNMQGLDNIKDVLLDNIIYYLTNDKDSELLHICIMGPPGVGKTVLANIIAQIYKNLGVLSKGHIIKVTRADLIGKYLGHTAIKTSDMIKKAEGGILFIDEVYSLVDKQGNDSFSKECVDTLTQHLTDKSKDLICIIAGYKTDIEQYFFKSNKGLDRRFSCKFTITGYTSDELANMFCNKMIENEWIIKDETIKDIKIFFNNKKDKFKNYGGDVDNLIHSYKLIHNRKNFFTRGEKEVCIDILIEAFSKLFGNDDEIEHKIFTSMYI